jgi:hypothetical protein
MSFEHKDNRGVLFVNDKKKDGDNKPDRTGTAMIGGEEYFVSGWIKDGSRGKFLSLAFTRKEEVAKKYKSSDGSDDSGGTPF